MKKHLALVICTICALTTFAQEALTYYLPDIKYDSKVPTPQSFLGFQVGEWHVSHDLQYHYMRQLAATSARVTLTEYGRTHEQRPLIYLTITSEKNQQQIETLKKQHRLLCEPDQSGSLNVNDLPAVLYQGFSIHGNEPSGGNAALLVAYYLAAGQSKELDELLDKTVILLDPCFNPDGFQRFSTWVNTNRNKNLTSDPQDREYNEPWPRGRTNHYWFDINRDWLPAQQPESRGRLHVFHEWRPNVLTDHHEMGSNSSFFFMPGEPQRVHPITPDENQVLTAKIAGFHAKALDKIGSLYFTREGYDDFYYGKGSTYPDANGCVGILFEQASSRGHVQETANGPLTFAFTIRNQVTTALSTHAAVVAMHSELLNYQREFYKSGLAEAAKDNRKAFIFADDYDPSRLAHFVDILQRHQIDVYQLGQAATIAGKSYSPGNAYVVPLDQLQYRMVKVAFETITEFKDSLFYDISTWTLPLAFDFNYSAIDRGSWKPGMLGEKVTGDLLKHTVQAPAMTTYAYVLDWNDFYAPKALYLLLKKDLRVKVSNQPFVTNTRHYDRGSILIPVENQKLSPAEIHTAVAEVTEKSGVQIWSEPGGMTPDGPDFGSASFETLALPKVLMVVGDGVSYNDAGEVWHLLDQRYDMELVLTEGDRFGGLDLNKYTTIILPDGNYGINQGGVDKLKRWVQEGGTLIAMQAAIRWAKDKGFANVELRTVKQDSTQMKKNRRPYEKQQDDAGAQVIGGAIFEATGDLTHPLLYGYHDEKFPVFRQGTLMLEPAKNPYATPLIYSSQPLMSGYINKANLNALGQSAAAIVGAQGRGHVICLVDNPAFRAFWFGGNKILANSIFFGPTINAQASERGD